MSFNQVQLIGRLGRDPEIRTTQGGDRIANLRVATSERWKDKSGAKQERVEWHTVVIFNDGLAGVAEKYLSKGSQIMVQGMLQTRKWQDKDGVDRWTTEVVLRSFSHTLVMLGDKQGHDDGGDRTADQPRSRPARSNAPQRNEYGDIDDDIPF